VLGEVLGGLAGCGSGRRDHFIAAAAMAVRRGGVCVRGPFIGAGEAEGVCGRRLEGRVRGVAAKTQRASPAGDAVGGPVGASADDHTQV
jgi:hypothetical protein